MKSSWLALALLTAATGRAAGASPPAQDFSVEFTDCIESIGVGLVPTAAVRASVPAEFTLAGESDPVTPVVVRTARCRGIGVDGGRARPGTIVQIGLVLVPPDFTGDINNFTLWYDTSDARLAQRLRQAGVAAQDVPGIVDAYVPAVPGDSDPLVVLVPPPARPTLAVAGHVTASSAPAGSFDANWWAQAGSARIKMETDVPSIFIGTADLTLWTSPEGPLGKLLGGGVASFPVLQQFNTFALARMSVSVSNP